MFNNWLKEKCRRDNDLKSIFFEKRFIYTAEKPGSKKEVSRDNVSMNWRAKRAEIKAKVNKQKTHGDLLKEQKELKRKLAEAGKKKVEVIKPLDLNELNKKSLKDLEGMVTSAIKANSRFYKILEKEYNTIKGDKKKIAEWLALNFNEKFILKPERIQHFQTILDKEAKRRLGENPIKRKAIKETKSRLKRIEVSQESINKKVETILENPANATGYIKFLKFAKSYPSKGYLLWNKKFCQMAISQNINNPRLAAMHAKGFQIYLKKKDPDSFNGQGYFGKIDGKTGPYTCFKARENVINRYEKDTEFANALKKVGIKNVDELKKYLGAPAALSSKWGSKFKADLEKAKKNLDSNKKGFATHDEVETETPKKEAVKKQVKINKKDRYKNRKKQEITPPSKDELSIIAGALTGLEGVKWYLRGKKIIRIAYKGTYKSLIKRGDKWYASQYDKTGISDLSKATKMTYELSKGVYKIDHLALSLTEYGYSRNPVYRQGNHIYFAAQEKLKLDRTLIKGIKGMDDGEKDHLCELMNTHWRTGNEYQMGAFKKIKTKKIEKYDIGLAKRLANEVNINCKFKSGKHSIVYETHGVKTTFVKNANYWFIKSGLYYWKYDKKNLKEAFNDAENLNRAIKELSKYSPKNIEPEYRSNPARPVGNTIFIAWKGWPDSEITGTYRPIKRITQMVNDWWRKEHFGT